jgi:hypothetical protein
MGATPDATLKHFYLSGIIVMDDQAMFQLGNAHRFSPGIWATTVDLNGRTPHHDVPRRGGAPRLRATAGPAPVPYFGNLTGREEGSLRYPQQLQVRPNLIKFRVVSVRVQ